jgi:hypothetical protein
MRDADIGEGWEIDRSVLQTKSYSSITCTMGELQFWTAWHAPTKAQRKNFDIELHLDFVDYRPLLTAWKALGFRVSASPYPDELLQESYGSLMISCLKMVAAALGGLASVY